jgi:hypothetical protein
MFPAMNAKAVQDFFESSTLLLEGDVDMHFVQAMLCHGADLKPTRIYP